MGISKVVGSYFLSECVDIVERGEMYDIKVGKITIEGVHQEEIFRYDYYTPEEEGYGNEDR